MLENFHSYRPVVALRRLRRYNFFAVTRVLIVLAVMFGSADASSVIARATFRGVYAGEQAVLVEPVVFEDALGGC